MNDLNTTDELNILLQKIKERPGLYLGCKSLINLRTFINGFLYAMHIASGKEYIGFYDGFQDWIANRYQIKSPHSWNSIISFYSVDESAAFDRFYELLNEFLQEQQNTKD